MPKGRLDTRAIGLDVGAEFARWLTGTEHLHYGLWTGLEVNAGNLGQAQKAYTNRLFGYLPEGPLSILDIGGGAGANARELIARGHEVEIVTPSPALAERCRTNAPAARTHESTFEAFQADRRFDLCLFSESLQYIPLEIALDKARELTKPGGHVLIADCFRAEGFERTGTLRPVGGGHRVEAFAAAIEGLALQRVSGEDITEDIAPSIDVEQGFYKIFGNALTRFDAELETHRPKTRGIARGLVRMLVSKRRRTRLKARLEGEGRTSADFVRNNRYLITLLRRGE